jgi:biotin carboxyl carrier protein
VASFTYLYNGQPVTVELQAHPDGTYTAVIGGRTLTFAAQPVQNDGWLLTLNGERSVVYAARRGENRYVSLAGHDYVLVVPDARTTRRRKAAGSGDLTAQMPGQVMDVLVSEGQAVTRGQTLVILEAMKMEIRVAAPTDGRVSRLLARPGAVVERGQLLLEIETLPVTD